MGQKFPSTVSARESREGDHLQVLGPSLGPVKVLGVTREVQAMPGFKTQAALFKTPMRR